MLLPLHVYFLTKIVKQTNYHVIHTQTSGNFLKKVFLKISQKSHENTCARVSFLVIGLRPATLLKKRLALMFSCRFCEIPKNIFFYRTPRVAAPVYNFT